MGAPQSARASGLLIGVAKKMPAEAGIIKFSASGYSEPPGEITADTSLRAGVRE